MEQKNIKLKVKNLVRTRGRVFNGMVTKKISKTCCH